MAFFIYHLISLIKKKTTPGSLIISLLSFILTFLLLNEIIFQTNLKDFFSFYFSSAKHYPIRFTENLDYYYTVASGIFPFYGNYIPTIWLFFSVAGLIFCFYKKVTTTEIFVICYLLMLLFYPYSSGGFRLISPVFPFLIYYMAIFFRECFRVLKITAYQNLTALILLLFLSGGVLPVYSTFKQPPDIVEGPQHPDSKELFEYLRKSGDDSTLIVFCKTRAIALFTGLHATYFPKEQSMAETADQFRRMNVSYLVVSNNSAQKSVPDPRLEKFISTYPFLCKSEWKNGSFQVYRFIR